MSDRTKRVVLVMDYGDIRGGLEKVCIESALALREAGKEVVFFCGVAPVDLRLEQAGISVTCLGVQDIGSDSSKLRAAATGLWNKAAARELDRVIRDTDDLSTTVVHVHGWTKSLSSAIGPVVTAPDVRHVFTIHEYFFACPNGGFYDYQSNEICRSPALGSGCLTTNCDVRHPAHKAYRVLRQAVQKGRGGLPARVKNIIYISELQKEVMQPYFPASTAFRQVANPAVSQKRAPVQVAENKDFYFVGRLVETKGALEFALAARDAGIPAVFVGDGPLRGAIEAANPSATILGWQNPNEVMEHLHRARALVFPSKWYECQPLVPIEAQALGIPVICGDWCASRESVAHEETGLHIRSLDEKGGFQDALARLSSAEYAARLGQTAYDRYWSDPLTMERHLDRLLSVYEQT
ncbi:glycosyltransferase family 4 protein [Ruegeria sp. SCP11]|uniref:glycosyltransferase family 4 protein n=1 Tax=Ruegeria sp. SCP11 TaxID=3141378 RepID=UPI003339AD3A